MLSRRQFLASLAADALAGPAFAGDGLCRPASLKLTALRVMPIALPASALLAGGGRLPGPVFYPQSPPARE